MEGIKIKDRVELHPSTDAWMMGDRYGEVVAIASTGRYVKVLLDKSGRILKFHPMNVTVIDTKGN